MVLCSLSNKFYGPPPEGCKAAADPEPGGGVAGLSENEQSVCFAVSGCVVSC